MYQINGQMKLFENWNHRQGWKIVGVGCLMSTGQRQRWYIVGVGCLTSTGQRQSW